jgi:hypothetical protein
MRRLPALKQVKTGGSAPGNGMLASSYRLLDWLRRVALL